MVKKSIILMFLEEYTSLSQQWRKINALWYKIFMKFLGETNLTYTEAMVLLATLSLDIPSKSDISKYMRCEPQSITRAINSLVSKELLQRKLDINDKRVVRFDLTKTGHAFSVKTQNFINVNWQKSLGDIDRESLNVFTNQLNEIISNLEHVVDNDKRKD